MLLDQPFDQLDAFVDGLDARMETFGERALVKPLKKRPGLKSRPVVGEELVKPSDFFFLEFSSTFVIIRFGVGRELISCVVGGE